MDSNMITRLLSTLNYPDASTLDTSDENELRKIIAWVEDKVVRKYNQEQRKNLLNINSSEWNKAYIKYKEDLKCPVVTNTFWDELLWILFCAVKHEHDSNRKVYDQHIVANLEFSNVPNVIADNPLDKLDFGSKDFEDGIKELTSILKIPPHPNLFSTHKAASKIISNRLNRLALENPKDFIIKGTPFPFESMDLGIDFGDEQLNKAVKILHLLYIQNFRVLQTKANEMIVALQTITANPKTDTKLGKVGI